MEYLIWEDLPDLSEKYGKISNRKLSLNNRRNHMQYHENVYPLGVVIDRLNILIKYKSANDKQLEYDFADSRYLMSLEQYLLIGLSKNSKEKEIVKLLIETTVALGYESDMYAIIASYIERRRNKDFNLTSLDFKTLYQDIGDYLLFGKCNPEIAVRWYDLSAYDWDSNGSLEVKQRDYYYIYELGLSEIESEDVLNKDFNKFVMADQRKNKLTTLLRLANTFVKDFNNIDYFGIEKSTLKKYYYMLFYIRKRMIVPSLLLFDEEDMRSKLFESLILCLQNVGNSDLWYLKNNCVEILKEEYGYRYIKQLAHITSSVISIKDLLIENNKRELCYYTSINSLVKMAPEFAGSSECGKLTIMNAAYMNDPNEGKVLDLYFGFPTVHKNPSGRIDARLPVTFIKCFCDKVDDLPMWEMYGDHAKGCCVIVDLKSLKREHVELYKVCYITKKSDVCFVRADKNLALSESAVKKIDEHLKNINNIWESFCEIDSIKNILLMCVKNAIDDITYLFKDDSYYYEKEYRLLFRKGYLENDIKYTEKRETGVPLLMYTFDIVMPIKEIILGPKIENPMVVVPFVEREFLKMASIRRSRVPLISYSSIEYK